MRLPALFRRGLSAAIFFSQNNSQVERESWPVAAENFPLDEHKNPPAWRNYYYYISMRFIFSQVKMVTTLHRRWVSLTIPDSVCQIKATKNFFKEKNGQKRLKMYYQLYKLEVKSKETVGNSCTVLKVILGHKYHHNH